MPAELKPCATAHGPAKAGHYRNARLTLRPTRKAHVIRARAGSDVLRSGPSEACRASVRWANAPQAGDTGLGLGAPNPRLRDTGSGGAFARRADRHASRTSVPAYARAAATSYRMRAGFSRQSDEMTK